MSVRDAGRRADGFTLIEMLASIFLTSLVISVAVGFYINLSRATETATQRLRDTRHAATIMDRIARDLRSTLLLVKPEEVDPLEHPWIFLAEVSRVSEGADRLKFVARGTERAHADAQNPSGLSVVSYLLEGTEGDEGLYELYRFATAGLPESLDRDFPSVDDPGARLIAENIETFSFRFRRGGGETWLDSWDSSTLAGSGELPDEIEIRLALRDGSRQPQGDLDAQEARVHTRRVALIMRPIDIEEQIEQARIAAGGGSGENGCITVADCLAQPQNRQLWQDNFDRCAADLNACRHLENNSDLCYTPALLPGAVGCHQ